MTGTDVVCHYYEPVKAALLREAVLPAATELAATELAATEPAGSGLLVHVERHWLYGPHVRLCLDGPGPEVGRAATEVAGRLRRHVTAHPSVVRVSEATLLADAAAAGRAELIAPPYGPLWPDNTVRTEATDRAALTALLGADGVAARVELLRLGLLALQANLDYLGRCGDTAAARVQVAVAAMTVHACRYPAGLTAGYHSYLSHLSDFLELDDADGRFAEAFRRAWLDRHGPVTALVARVAGGRLAEHEHSWATWSSTSWQRIAARVSAGQDLAGSAQEYRRRAHATGDAATAERWDPRQRTRFSEYHQLINRADPDGTARTHPSRVIYRTCTNALYRLLAICDVTPAERYLAAYLIVRAVAALTGHDWRAEMEVAIAAAHDAAGTAP